LTSAVQPWTAEKGAIRVPPPGFRLIRPEKRWNKAFFLAPPTVNKIHLKYESSLFM